MGGGVREGQRRQFDRLTEPEREKLIAVHEAGHAVAHFYHQSLFERMSLSDEGGLVNVGPMAFVADALFVAMSGDPEVIRAHRLRNDYKVAAAVDTLMAGSLAEFRWMKWRSLVVAAGDENLIDRVLRHVYGEGFGLIAPRAKSDATRRLRCLFRRQGVWRAALDLADQLVRRRVMEGIEVFNFFRERGVPSTGLRDYMKASRAAARKGAEPPPA